MRRSAPRPRPLPPVVPAGLADPVGRWQGAAGPTRQPSLKMETGSNRATFVPTINPPAEAVLWLFRYGAVGADLGGGREDGTVGTPLGQQDDTRRDQGHVPEEQVGERLRVTGLGLDALAVVSIAHVLHRVFGHVLGAAVAGYHVTAGREGRLEGGDDGCRVLVVGEEVQDRGEDQRDGLGEVKGVPDRVRVQDRL